MASAASPVQVVRGDSSFAEEFADFCSVLAAEWPAPDRRRKRQYVTVSIFGAQSSGKSTLLNDTLGASFSVLDERDGRHQTTKGVWVAAVSGCGEEETSGRPEGESLEQTRRERRVAMGAGTMNSSPVHPAPLLLLDCEGGDSRERTIAKTQSIENRIASFAAAVSDILLLNLWETDVGRYNAANYNTLSSVFGIYFRSLIGSRPLGSRLKLLFVIRDAREDKGPAADKIAEMLTADVVAIYKDVVSDGGFDPSGALAALRGIAQCGEGDEGEEREKRADDIPRDRDGEIDLRECFDRFFQIDVCYIAHRRFEPERYAQGTHALRQRLMALQCELADEGEGEAEREGGGDGDRGSGDEGESETKSRSENFSQRDQRSWPAAASSADSRDLRDPADPATPATLSASRHSGHGGSQPRFSSAAASSSFPSFPAALPVDALPDFFSRIWDTIVSNRELDIITQKELVSRSRCDEIARDIVEEAHAAMDEVREYIVGSSASLSASAVGRRPDNAMDCNAADCSASIYSTNASLVSTTGGHGRSFLGLPYGDGVPRAGPVSRSMLLASPIDARRSSRGGGPLPAESSTIGRGISQASTMENESRGQRSFLGDRSLDRSACERGRRDSRYGLRPSVLQPLSVNPHGVVSSLLNIRRESLQRYVERTSRYPRQYSLGGYQLVDNECQIGVSELCGLLLERLDAYVAAMLRVLNEEAGAAIAEAVSKWGGRGDELPPFLAGEKSPGFFSFQALLKTVAEAARAYRHEAEYAKEVAEFLGPLLDGLQADEMVGAAAAQADALGLGTRTAEGYAAVGGLGGNGDGAGDGEGEGEGESEGAAGRPGLSGHTGTSMAVESPGTPGIDLGPSVCGMRDVVIRNDRLLSLVLGEPLSAGDGSAGAAASSLAASSGQSCPRNSPGRAGARAPSTPPDAPQVGWKDVFRTQDYFSVLLFINNAPFFCLSTWTEPLCRATGLPDFAEESRAACLQAGYEQIAAGVSRIADLIAEELSGPTMAQARQGAAELLHSVPQELYGSLEGLRERLLRQYAFQLEEALRGALRIGPLPPCGADMAEAMGATGAAASLDVSALDPAVELPGLSESTGLARSGRSIADSAASRSHSGSPGPNQDFIPELVDGDRVWSLEHPGGECPAGLVPVWAFLRQADRGIAKRISDAVSEFSKVSLASTLHNEFRRSFVTDENNVPRVWRKGDDITAAYELSARRLREFALALLGGELSPAEGECVTSPPGGKNCELGGSGRAGEEAQTSSEGAGAPPESVEPGSPTACGSGPVVIYVFPAISLCPLSEREQLRLAVHPGAGSGSRETAAQKAAMQEERDRLEPSLQGELGRMEAGWKTYYDQALRDRDASIASSGSWASVPWQVWLLVAFFARRDIKALLKSKIFMTLALVAAVSVYLFMYLTNTSGADLLGACRAAKTILAGCLASGDVAGAFGAVEPFRNLLTRPPAQPEAGTTHQS